MNDARPSAVSHDGSGKPAETAAARRPWYRLHVSTWVIAATAAAVLTLMTLPGRVHFGPEGGGNSTYEHGWPLVFFERLGPAGGTLDLESVARTRGLRLASMYDIATGEPRYATAMGDDELSRAPWLVANNWTFGGKHVVYTAAVALDLATASALLASLAAACECWKRRRWRYSLRSVLGAFILVAAALGWWRISMDRYQRQSRAVADIVRKGFDVAWSCDAPVWLDILVGPNRLRAFHRVTHVSPYSLSISPAGKGADLDAVTDADLAHFSDLTELEGLLLHGTRVTDASLERLHHLTGLRYLDIVGTSVTDQGVKKLRQALPHCKIDWGPP
jgi:hypothetical protein